MDHRARFSSLSATYDDFLFAQVGEDANGIGLSILSALARMNVDPWEEAGRLAAMPKTMAEKSLLSALDRVSGRSWNSPEAAAIAARLVGLLPQRGQAAATRSPAPANAAAKAANGRERLTSYWWVWLGFWVAMSLMAPHHQRNSTHAGVVTSTPSATIPSKSSHSITESVGSSF